MKRLLAGVMALMMAVPAMATEVGDDGLYKTPWLRDTFKCCSLNNAAVYIAKRCTKRCF
jgi:hypothetical protein